MLIGSARILGTPVMSLHLGGPVGWTRQEIIDPEDLRVVGFFVDLAPEAGQESGEILRTRDIREFSRLGMVIDSEDDLVNEGDVVKLDKVIGLGFSLVGFKVVSKSGAKLGKVVDYTLDTRDFLVAQLIIKRPVLKGFLDPELVIGRREIVEINNTAIVVKDEKGAAPGRATREEPIAMTDFVNPFREAPASAASASEDETQ